jgi:hypothetical protein
MGLERRELKIQPGLLGPPGSRSHANEHTPI